jgi:O-antigen/teichoic acid export membrane protein
LVAQQIANKFIVYFTVSMTSGWKPAIEFSVTALKELFGFSAYVFLTRLLQYAALSVDKLITGKYLGANSVGLIDKAQSMMLFPLQNISHTISGVMFPALSLLNGDLPRIRKIYLKCIEAVSFLTFPMMVGMFVVSESFILGVLGEHWSELIPIFQIFCFAGLINSIATITGAVYLSQGESKLQFRVNLVTRPLAIGCVIIGLSWGIIGVVWGIVIAAWISGIYAMMVAWKLIGLSRAAVLRVLFPIISLSFLMGTAVYLIGGMASSYGFLVTLLIQIISGGFIYLLAAVVSRMSALESVKEALSRR